MVASIRSIPPNGSSFLAFAYLKLGLPFVALPRLRPLLLLDALLQALGRQVSLPEPSPL